MPKKDTKLQKLSENIYIIIEKIKGLGIEDLDRMFMEEYLEQAGQLTDICQQTKVWYPPKAVIGIVFFALLAGNDEWTEIPVILAVGINENHHAEAHRRYA